MFDLSQNTVRESKSGFSRPGFVSKMASDDKHDLTSSGLSDDHFLESVFDAEAIVKIPDQGEHVKKIQQALMNLGIFYECAGCSYQIY